MIIGQETSLGAKRISQEVYRDKMASSIMKHNYSFFVVKHDWL